MAERPSLPPELVLDRVLTPERSFVVRVREVGMLAVARRCSGRAPRLRRRLERLAAAAPASVVIESRLIEHGGACWSIRPWISGRPLRALRTDRALPRDEALGLLLGVVEAAAALNRSALVHGRLHAANVLLDESGQVRIVDALDVGALPSPQVADGAAEVSLAPEILRGEGARANTDVYGVALILCELLSGAHPFAATSTFESTRRALYEQPEPWHLEGAAVPSELVPTLRRALAKRPTHRTRSVDELVSSLYAQRPSRAPLRATSLRLPAAFWSASLAGARAWIRIGRVADGRRVRLARAHLKRLADLLISARVRRAVVAAVAVAAVGAAIADWSTDSPLEREVETSLAAGDFAGAEALVRRHQRKSGEEAAVRKLWGDISCARGEHTRCLELYLEALEREPRFASNERLKRNALALLDRGELQSPLRQLVMRLDEVDDALVNDTRAEHYWRRWNAVHVLEARGLAHRIDYGVVYGSDVVHAGTCSTRRASLAKIIQLRTSSSLPYLEQAREKARGVLFGGWCLGNDLDRAIDSLAQNSKLTAQGP